MAIRHLTDNQAEGTDLGQSAAELLGFHGAAPTAQRSGAAQAAVSGTAGATYTATEQGIINNAVTLLNELRAALVAKGLIKGAA